ncbi:MAG: Sas10/Utp3/C1D family protein [archaeon]|nr:Sas10/Utp3/C1D family protein [archaeon]
MEIEEDISPQIELLKGIEKAIDDCDNSINKIIEKDNFPENISNSKPKERAYFYWTNAFGVYTSYHLHLKLNGIKTKDHPILKEIQRLQEFRDNIRQAEGTLPGGIKKHQGQSKGDKKAAEKYIQNILSQSNDKVKKKKE